jgi:hypothetical protein
LRAAGLAATTEIRRYRARMIREMDLGQVVLQWRDDGRWRAVDQKLLADERRGVDTPGDELWVEVQPGRMYSAGPTHVYGLVVDGIPDRVTVGDEDVPVRVLEGLWGAHWAAEQQRVVIYANGRQAAVFDLSRRPGHIAPPPGEPVLHDQPARGWFRPGPEG